MRRNITGYEKEYKGDERRPIGPGLQKERIQNWKSVVVVLFVEVTQSLTQF